MINKVFLRFCLGCFISVTVFTVAACAEYVGDFAIDLLPQDHENPYRAFTLALTEVTPGYYQMTGTHTSADGSAAGATMGTAYVAGEHIYVSLLESNLGNNQLAAGSYSFDFRVNPDQTGPLLVGTYRQVLRTQDDEYRGQLSHGIAVLGIAAASSIDFSDIDGDGDGFTISQGDCSDFDPDVNSDATELNDGIDNNCNGEIDEGFELNIWYADSDADSYGDKDSSTQAHTQPDGYVAVSGDCDDSNGNIHPGAAEICGNFVDENCDMVTSCDQDGDHYRDALCSDHDDCSDSSFDCDDTNSSCHPGATDIANNDFDEDCDGHDIISPAQYTDINGIVFVAVPGGTFSMGSEGEAADELPVHQVKISTFYLAETELTEQQFETIRNDSQSTGHPNRPVDGISALYATALIAELPASTGVPYRLPTEAEWEYAASNLGHGGDYLSSPGQYAWYAANSGGELHDVKGKQPNPLNLYDIRGNIAELVSDYYGSSYYATCNAQGTVDDPEGPEEGSLSIYRGGFYGTSSSILTPTRRIEAGEKDNGSSHGLRLALPAQYVLDRQ